jgi:hypothetical protein
MIADRQGWYVYAHTGDRTSPAQRLSDQNGDLVLQRARTLQGRVEGETSGIVPVVVAIPSDGNVMTILDGPVAIARTRSDGTFTLQMPPGVYRAWARLGTRVGPMVIARDGGPLILRTPSGRQHRVVVHNDLPDVSAFRLWIAEGTISGGTGEELATDATRLGVGFRYAETYPDPEGRPGHFDHAWDIDIPAGGTLCFTLVRGSDSWREVAARKATCLYGPFSDPIVFEPDRD